MNNQIPCMNTRACIQFSLSMMRGWKAVVENLFISIYIYTCSRKYTNVYWNISFEYFRERL